MKRTHKYAGLDVHQVTTVIVVMEESGRVIAREILPTEPTALTAFFRGMRGSVHVVFEEGTQAHWLYDLLMPLVERVVVCNLVSGPASDTASAGDRGAPALRFQERNVQRKECCRDEGSRDEVDG